VLPWAVDARRSAGVSRRSTRCSTPDGSWSGAVTLLEDVTHLSEIKPVEIEFIAAPRRTSCKHRSRGVQMGIYFPARRCPPGR